MNIFSKKGMLIASALSIPALAAAGYIEQVKEEGGENPVAVVGKKALAGVFKLTLKSAADKFGLDIKVTPRKIEPLKERSSSNAGDQALVTVLKEMKSLREDQKKSDLDRRADSLDEKARRLNAGSHASRNIWGGFASTIGFLGVGFGVSVLSPLVTGLGGVLLGLGAVSLASSAIDESAEAKK